MSEETEEVVNDPALPMEHLRKDHVRPDHFVVCPKCKKHVELPRREFDTSTVEHGCTG